MIMLSDPELPRLRRRRWQRDLEGYECPCNSSYGDVSTDISSITGGSLTESQMMGGRILTGVATGVLIWFATRMLDRILFNKKK